MLALDQADDPELGRQARAAISAEENPVFVSAASVWEVSIKRSLGIDQCPKIETAYPCLENETLV